MSLLLTCAASAWALARTHAREPKRPEEPFLVFVSASAEDAADDERAQIEEALAELTKRIGRKDAWFRLTASEEKAEISVDLINYATRQERRVLSTWGVVPPTEGGQRGKTQVIEIVTYHYLEAQVELFGAERILRGEKVRNDRGRAKDAVGDLVGRLEKLCRDEYDYLMRRRRTSRSPPRELESSYRSEPAASTRINSDGL